MNAFNTIRWVSAIGLLTCSSIVMAQSTNQADQIQDDPQETTSAVEIVNAMCPVTTDEEVDPNFTIEYKGQTIGFCCKKCRTKFDEDPEAYIAQLPTLQSVAQSTSASEDPIAEEHEGHMHDELAQAHVDKGSEHLDGDDGGKPHDHAHDHGQDDEEAGFKLLPYLGRFHILIIHFPIALLVMAGFFEFLGMLRRRSSHEGIVRPLVAFGALSSIAAVALGLMNAIEADYLGKLASVFWWHRALGITLMVSALITWVLVEKRHRIKGEGGYMPARVAIFFCAALVGVTAHFGGSLVYGWTYLFP